MNDPQTTVLYTLSTLAQTFAALAAFVGAVGIFRLQSLRDRRGEAEREIRAEYKMWGVLAPDAMVVPLSDVLNAIEQPHPALSAEGPSRAKAARDRWRGVKSAVARSRRALIFFEAWNLETLDAFYLEHRRCGELDGGVDQVYVWLACPTCRTSMVKTGMTPPRHG